MVWVQFILMALISIILVSILIAHKFVPVFQRNLPTRTSDIWGVRRSQYRDSLRRDSEVRVGWILSGNTWRWVGGHDWPGPFQWTAPFHVRHRLLDIPSGRTLHLPKRLGEARCQLSKSRTRHDKAHHLDSTPPSRSGRARPTTQHPSERTSPTQRWVGSFVRLSPR